MSSRRKKSEPAGDLHRKLRLLPGTPGVYLHKSRTGKVIYVGKAKRLAQRVRSYFQTGERDPKTALLVHKIADFDYIATDSEAEALVLENQLIKEYRPLYNVRLKDDKQYPYLRISLQEPFPRVTVTRRISDDGARYFGPYTDVRAPECSRCEPVASTYRTKRCRGPASTFRSAAVARRVCNTTRGPGMGARYAVWCVSSREASPRRSDSCAQR